MANDNKEKKNNEKNIFPSCKPCTPIKQENESKERSNDVKNVPSTQPTRNTDFNETKCKLIFPQDSSRNASTTTKSSIPHTSKAEANTPSHVDSSGTAACEMKPLSVTNPYIAKMDEDILYHIALGNKSHDLPKMFGDVKFIIMGSTPKRMEQVAYYIANEIGFEIPACTILNDISKSSHRYAMYKAGPILSVSHGMGNPSIGILLHELIKLVFHAGIKDVIFVKIGTCGGFGKENGTVVVSNEVVNDFMEPFYELVILGERKRFSATLNQTVVNEILECSEPIKDQFETVAGITYCTDNFYEGSGRTDGAICEFSEQDAVNYYKQLHRNGIINLEMESLAFAALTCRAGIKSAIITVVLNDRLEMNQAKQTKEVINEWQMRPQKLLAKYIKKKLSISNATTSPTSGVTTVTVPKTDRSDLNDSKVLCKSCASADVKKNTEPGRSANTGFNEEMTTSKPSSNDPSVCKPCVLERTLKSRTISDERTTSKPVADGSPVCKPCIFGNTSKPNIMLKEETTSRPSAYASSTDKPFIESTSESGKVFDEKTTSKPSPSVCKPCLFQNTSKPGAMSSEETSSKSSFNDSSTRKPCFFGSTPRPSATSNENTTSKSSPLVCKPCIFGSTSKPNTASIDETTAKTTSDESSTRKPCVLGSSLKSETTPKEETTAKPTSDDSSTRKPCFLGSSLKSDATPKEETTAKPKSDESTTRKPCFFGITSKPDIKSANEKTTSKSSSVCKPSTRKPCAFGNDPTTIGTPSAIKTSKLSKDEPTVCKPCLFKNDSKATNGKTALSTIKPSNSRVSVCKPCTLNKDSSSLTTTELTTQVPSNSPANSGLGSKATAEPTKPSLCRSYFVSETTVRPSSIEKTESKEKDNPTPSLSTPKTYLAKDFDSSSKSTISNDSWRSCYQKCSNKPASTGTSSGPQIDLTSTTIKPSPGFFTPEQDKMKGFPVNKLGPCCSPKASIQEVNDARGPCCTGKSSSSSSSDECANIEDTTDGNNAGNLPEKDVVPNKKYVDECPISIRGPCRYIKEESSSDLSQSQTPSQSYNTTPPTSPPSHENTLKPSPDTPDPSTTRAMPEFITPTPRKSSANCTAKFSNNNVTTQSSFVNEKSNGYDDNSSPCAVCRKRQEKKNQNTGILLSDSQPEIVKCPHKLKRLKDECKGYD